MLRFRQQLRQSTKIGAERPRRLNRIDGRIWKVEPSANLMPRKFDTLVFGLYSALLVVVLRTKCRRYLELSSVEALNCFPHSVTGVCHTPTFSPTSRHNHSRTVSVAVNFWSCLRLMSPRIRPGHRRPAPYHNVNNIVEKWSIDSRSRRPSSRLGSPSRKLPGQSEPITRGGLNGRTVLAATSCGTFIITTWRNEVA